MPRGTPGWGDAAALQTHPSRTPYGGVWVRGALSQLHPVPCHLLPPSLPRRLSGRSPFFELDPIETENRILAGRFDAFKLYPNVSQSAALFIRKVLTVHPW